MNSIDPARIAPQMAGTHAQAGGDAAHARTGTLLGQQAAVSSGEISLTDAAEELSLHMAEKTEDKHHAERKVRADKPLEAMPAEEIAKLFDDTHDADAQEKLHELANQLLKGGASPRQAAAQAFGDVSQQYLALHYALGRGESEGAPADVLEELREALADLDMQHGREIRAGLNSAAAAGAYADTAQDALAFQQTYRDVVLGENSLARTLNLALERFGAQNVAAGLKQLVLALGQDLAAARPSVEPSRLQALVQDLYQLEVAVTVLETCGELAQTLQTVHATRIDPERLMRDLVEVSGEKWVSESRFTGMAGNQGVASVPAQIAFMSGVRGVMRELPLQVYPDADTRQGILNAVQDALDDAIDKEEA